MYYTTVAETSALLQYPIEGDIAKGVGSILYCGVGHADGDSSRPKE